MSGIQVGGGFLPILNGHQELLASLPEFKDDDDDSVYGDGESHASNGSASSNSDADDGEIQQHQSTQAPSGGHMHHSHIDDFKKFAENCGVFDTTLENFSNYVQKVGSAILLLKASRHLQDDVRDLLELLQHHGGSSFTRESSYHSTTDLTAKSKIPPRLAKYLQQHCSSEWTTSKDNKAALKRLCLSKSLDRVAWTLESFDSAVEDFPEFTNEDGRRNLLSFLSIVQGWSAAIQLTGKADDRHEYKHLVNRMTIQLSEAIGHMNASLEVFMKIGIPCIIAAQKRSFALLLNIATVATFLSAVTATTLQYSFASNDSSTAVAVNVCWLSSLVLSIASATNSLLTLAWRQAVFSTPRTRVPWWVLIWFRQSCLALLIAAVVTFIAGLVVFVVDTQHPVAIWVVVGLSGFCSLGLGSVTLWFSWERLDYRRLRNLHRDKRLQHFRSHQRSYLDLIRYYAVVIWSRFAELQKRRAPHKGSGDLEKSPADFLLQNLPTSNKTSSRWRTVGRKVIGANTMEKRLFASKAIWENDLADLSVVGEFTLPHGIVHMQFSPSGSLLVVCGRKGCSLYKVEDTLSPPCNLKHKSSRAKQAEWSPDGRRILTRTRHGFKIWIRNQEAWSLEKRIKCRATPKHVRWMNSDGKTSNAFTLGGNAQRQLITLTDFIAISDDSMFKMNVRDGEVEEFTLRTMGFPLRESSLTRFTFEQMQLTTTSSLVLLLINQVHPHRKSFAEAPWKHITAFDLVTRKFSHLKMSFDDITSFELSQDGKEIVFGYSDKLPDVWSLAPSGEQISKRHSCAALPSHGERFSGSLRLAGPSQCYISGTDMDGSTYLWRRNDGSNVRINHPAEHMQSPSSPIIAWAPPKDGRPLLARTHGTSTVLQLLQYRSAYPHPEPQSQHTASVDSQTTAPTQTEKKPGFLQKARRKVRRETRGDANSDKGRSEPPTLLRKITLESAGGLPLDPGQSRSKSEKDSTSTSSNTPANGSSHPRPPSPEAAVHREDHDEVQSHRRSSSDQEPRPPRSSSPLRSWRPRSWISIPGDSDSVRAPQRSTSVASVEITVESPSPKMDGSFMSLPITES